MAQTTTLAPDRVKAADHDGRPIVMGPCHVIRGDHSGQPVFFAVDAPDDVIQRHHMAGRFYERPELKIIRGAFKQGGRFVDLGANVGNHSLFAALILRASEVVPVEPNPMAFNLLRANMVLNRVDTRVDMRWLGFGVSDRASSGHSVAAPKGNLGGGRIGPGGGDVRLVTGDTVVGEKPADFIKIDTEGMEMQVLAGLAGTVARDRSVIFVEVDDENLEAFVTWLEAQDYLVANRHRRYKRGENFLIVPEERAEEFAPGGQDD